MNKAIFLDRDGVIIRERGDYTFLIKDVEINPGIIEALKDFIKKNFLLIIITNQGGVSKNIYTHEDVKNIHSYIQEKLFIEGIKFDAYYYCPHHPSITKCLCRKPDSLLLEKAIARFNINPVKSYFIGDNDRDIVAGQKVKVNTIKIESNASLVNLVDQIS